MRTKREWLVLGAAVVTVVAAVVFWPGRPAPESGVPARSVERTRAELDLRDGVLYAPDSEEPFNGNLVEDYGREARKLEIEIRNGKAHGRSRGWYEDGTQEVEETFVDGVSNGLRTRWYPNGAKKSEATIVDGKITGRFVRWHDNGQMSAAVTMVDGQPHGLAEGWHPSGNPKSRVQLEHGIPVKKEFFPDASPIVQSDNPTAAP
jgi:antitoxin component YwqK of YwqJK toxin-antitoxin module